MGSEDDLISGSWVLRCSFVEGFTEDELLDLPSAATVLQRLSGSLDSLTICIYDSLKQDRVVLSTLR